MSDFPTELELLSLFESEPVLSDDTEEMPMYYKEAVYRFTNGEEDFVVHISPASEEVLIQVSKSDSGKMLSLLDLKKVNKFKILADQNDRSSVLLITENEETVISVQVDFKPYFKQIVKEEFLNR
ncbi:hypothetical protein AUC31_14535 [Planococcus rifietoensis]|uniref:Uncharacterized protein n=1 Tax=Planococcus rifietoensis TaxID=200991 RepID=A0A0U2J7P7_9BACL|nr:hypothetical protein [Planococcus rifietoensis]ALS76338.1 hypothetical protein AUC31_14535 [Planococcus rifietoensis]